MQGSISLNRDFAQTNILYHREVTTISKMETVVQRNFKGFISEMVEFYNLDAFS